MNFNVEDLILRPKEYNEDNFKEDFSNLLKSYDELKPIDVDAMRQEIDDWDLSVPKETTIELEEISACYTKFIEYNTRINKMLDDANSHNELLKFIISTTKDLAVQYLPGKTKTGKESVAVTMLVPVAKLQNKIDILYSFVSNTNKSIEFATTQLARILREREAIGKINNEEYRKGSNIINRNNNNVVVNTRNKLNI